MTIGLALGPNQINVQQAPAVPGDFASGNPRQMYIAGPGGLVAGPAGLTIGRFAWVAPSPQDPNGTGTNANNNGFGPVSGFVHREQQGINTIYLANSGNLVPAGFPVALCTFADLWVLNSGTTEALPGMSCYANFVGGAASFAAAGAPSNSGTSTASTIAAGAGSVTGSISGNVLTVTAVLSGTLYPGGILSGGATLSGTQIVQQLTGTTGGVGTYLLNYGEQSVASTTISETYGLLTIGGTVTGSFQVGDTITGSGLAAGTQLTAAITGLGGAGTYVVNLTQTIGSQAINASVNVQTKWIAVSQGLPGEAVKITAQALG